MIRPATDGDIAAVREVLMSAFPSPEEAKLVDDLRATGDLVLCLAAEEAGIVGCVAFSRLGVQSPELRASALGPIGVRPKHQRKGIGSRLVEEGLSKLSETGEDLVIVLGEPKFYERFGFSREAAARLKTPYDGPYLLAKALTEKGSLACGEVRYAPAFAALG